MNKNLISPPLKVLQNRKEKLSSIIKPKEIHLFHTRDIMCKGDDEFFHSCDGWFQYYFLNADAEEMIGVVYKDENNSVHSIVGIAQKSEIMQKFQGYISHEEVKKISGVDDVMYIDELTKKIKQLAEEENYTISIVLDEKANYYSKFKEFLKKLETELKIDAENKINQLVQFREIKDEFEVECIRKANEIAREVFEEVLQLIHEYSTEQEVFAKLSYEIFRRNSTHSFYPIIASGKNSLTLHYTKHNSSINSQDLLLLDFGCEYLGYKSDISRTIPVLGKFTQQQKEIYQAVLDVQKFAISQVKEGVNFKEFEQKVAKKMGEELVKLNLISKDELSKNPNIVRTYFPHRCSHHLGLDTHDVGNYDVMKEGMVITIEPGLYIEELGVGIRIEDNVLVTKSGCENLSDDIIKELEEIENILKIQNSSK